MNRMFCRKVFICLPVAAFALAQQQPNFRAGARLVQVDVIVRDSHGPLTDLTKDDFGLFDRGKRQQISVFIVNAGRNSDRSPALTTREVSNRPDLSSGEAPSTTLVLVDFLNSRWQDQYFVRGELARFVGALGDSDRMALLALKKNLVVLQNFTNALNREQLLQAVERLPFEVNEGQLPGEQTVYWAKVRKGITERVLQSILRHLAAMPGRRNLIWISGNFWYDSRLSGSDIAGCDAIAEGKRRRALPAWRERAEGSSRCGRSRTGRFSLSRGARPADVHAADTDNWLRAGKWLRRSSQ